MSPVDQPSPSVLAQLASIAREAHNLSPSKVRETKLWIHSNSTLSGTTVLEVLELRQDVTENTEHWKIVTMSAKFRRILNGIVPGATSPSTVTESTKIIKKQLDNPRFEQLS